MLLTDIELHEAATLEQASELMGRYSPDARKGNLPRTGERK